MTLIVIRDGVMATDGGVWKHDCLVQDNGIKMRRMSCGIIAALGYVGYAFSAAVTEACSAEHIPDFIELNDETELILLGKDGRLYNYEKGGRSECNPPFFAVGPAAAVAIGAMHMGADAVRACQIGITVGPWAAGEVQAMSLYDEPTMQGDEPDDALEFGGIYPEDADPPKSWREKLGL